MSGKGNLSVFAIPFQNQFANLGLMNFTVIGIFVCLAKYLQFFHQAGLLSHSFEMCKVALLACNQITEKKSTHLLKQEVASTLARAKCFKNVHTIIFVAFDAEEVGCHGSLEFIRSFLIPDFIEKGYRIQGAFILDTLLNWDDNEGSQEVTEYWSEALPEVIQPNKRSTNVCIFLFG